MATAFGRTVQETLAVSYTHVEKLRTKIGRLVVACDFVADVSGLVLGTGGKKR